MLGLFCPRLLAASAAHRLPRSVAASLRNPFIHKEEVQMIEWQASRTRLPRSSLRPTPDLRDRLAVSRFDVVYALIFAAGIFLTVMLCFSAGATLGARFADAATTAIPWLIAPVVMWLSKAIPFFHRNETARWILVGAPALLVAMIVLALIGGNPSQ